MGATRRRGIGVAVVVLAVVIFWAPSIIATRFTSDVQPVDFLAHPDRGWQFLDDAVRLARRARVGTEGAALQVAHRTWSPADAVTVLGVDLVWLDGPVTIPLPSGARPIRERARTIHPRSPFTWFVDGRVDGGPRQTVGLIDALTGRVYWDVTHVMPPREPA